MRIERRLPFGFTGDWGKLYKRYTFTDSVAIKPGEVIQYEKNNYRDFGQDVQFKRGNETTTEIEQPLDGLLVEVEHTTAKTTDAYFDNKRREYMCVVEIGDIIVVFGRTWIVTGIKTVSRDIPAPLKFFYCDIKSISGFTYVQ